MLKWAFVFCCAYLLVFFFLSFFVSLNFFIFLKHICSDSQKKKVQKNNMNQDELLTPTSDIEEEEGFEMIDSSSKPKRNEVPETKRINDHETDNALLIKESEKLEKEMKNLEQNKTDLQSFGLKSFTLADHYMDTYFFTFLKMKPESRPFGMQKEPPFGCNEHTEVDEVLLIRQWRGVRKISEILSGRVGDFDTRVGRLMVSQPRMLDFEKRNLRLQTMVKQFIAQQRPEWFLPVAFGSLCEHVEETIDNLCMLSLDIHDTLKGNKNSEYLISVLQTEKIQSCLHPNARSLDMADMLANVPHRPVNSRVFWLEFFSPVFLYNYIFLCQLYGMILQLTGNVELTLPCPPLGCGFMKVIPTLRVFHFMKIHGAIFDQFFTFMRNYIKKTECLDEKIKTINEKMINSHSDLLVPLSQLNEFYYREEVRRVVDPVIERMVI